MKFVGVREAQQKLSGLVDHAQQERVVLTRHGKPVALLTGVEGQNLEDALLLQDPEFRRMMAERLAYKGPFIPHEVLEAEARRELRRTRARRRRRSKSR